MKHTLITVTFGGDVRVTPCESLETCEQARSIALTGMTIEENKAADEAYAKCEHDWGGVGTSPSYSPDRGESMEVVRGQFVLKTRNDIKWAKCVIEPETSARSAIEAPGAEDVNKTKEI